MAHAIRPQPEGPRQARTNIVLDVDLVERAMKLYKVRSKREVVELALRHLVGDPMTREEALAMKGYGWDGDLDAIRRGTPGIEL